MTAHASSTASIHCHGEPWVTAHVSFNENTGCTVLEISVTDPKTGGDLGRMTLFLHGTPVGVSGEARQPEWAFIALREMGLHILTQTNVVEREYNAKPVPRKQTV